MRKITKLLIMMGMLFVFTGCGKKADTKIWKSTTDPQELADFYASFKEANRPDNILSSYEEYTVVVTTSYAGDDYEAIDTVQRTKNYGYRQMNFVPDDSYYDLENNIEVSTEDGKIYAYVYFYDASVNESVDYYTDLVGRYEEDGETLTELIRNDDGTYTITSKYGTNEEDFLGHMEVTIVYEADAELKCTSINISRDYFEDSDYNNSESITVTYGGQLKDYDGIFKHINPSDGEKCTVSITDVATGETKSITVDKGIYVQVNGSLCQMTTVYVDEACTEVVDEIIATSSEQQYYIDIPASEQDMDALNSLSIANPMQELTDEMEIEELSYGLILPKGAKDVETYLINEYILERMFVVDGVNYTMRVATGDTYEDISGMYYDWNSVTEINYPTDKSVHMLFYNDEEYADVFNWFDEELSVNYSMSSIDCDSQVSVLIDQMIPLSIRNRRSQEQENAEIPGLPSISSIESGFSSFIDWAGLQSFYEGIEFDELTDEIKVATAVYCAQKNDPEIVLDDTGCKQILTEDKIKQAMMDLYGETCEIKASNNICEKGLFEIKNDGSACVQLGDWGLVCPEVEIISAEPGGEGSGEFYASVLYYPHDLETDHISFNIPNYLCRCKCKINDNSRFGFSIIEMDGSIEE